MGRECREEGVRASSYVQSKCGVHVHAPSNHTPTPPKPLHHHPNLCPKCLTLYSCVCLNIANHWHVLQARVLRGCNGCNQCVVENPVHPASNAPSRDVAIYPVVFSCCDWHFARKIYQEILLTFIRNQALNHCRINVIRAVGVYFV